MNAHDRLEQQLAASVRQRRPATAGRHRRRSAAALCGVLVLGGGGAALATALVGGPGVEKNARALEVQAIRETRNAQACTYADSLKRGVLVEGNVPAEVKAALPFTATPNRTITREEQATAARVGGFRIVRPSFITAVFPGGIRLAAGVVEGASLGGLTDPAACLRAREDVVRENAGKEDPVRAAALRQLRVADDVRPGVQTFWLWTVGPTSSGGAGNVIRPGTAIPTGLLGSGGGEYNGLVQSGTTTVDVRSRRTGAVLLKVTPQHGLFAFKLPKGTGPATLRQLDATGKVLAHRRLR